MLYGVFALILISFNLVKMDYYIDDFIKLYPLEGQWTMPYDGGELVEIWTKQFEKKLKGQTIFIKNEQEEKKEVINLVLKEGRIYYTPEVKGMNDDEPVPFTLTEMDDNKFVFENREHDFPRRITYELKGNNRLYATIEGTTKKGFRKVEYKYVRRAEDLQIE